MHIHFLPKLVIIPCPRGASLTHQNFVKSSLIPGNFWMRRQPNLGGLFALGFLHLGVWFSIFFLGGWGRRIFLVREEGFLSNQKATMILPMVYKIYIYIVILKSELKTKNIPKILILLINPRFHGLYHFCFFGAAPFFFGSMVFGFQKKSGPRQLVTRDDPSPGKSY